MLQVPADQNRRIAIQTPSSFAGYDAMVVELQKRDPNSAFRAALHACTIDPQNRRLRKNLIFLLNSSNRWRELDTHIPRDRRPAPERPHRPVDLVAAEARYDWLMDQMRQRSWEGWTPSRVEISKYNFPLNQRNLAAFRGSEISSGTQTIPDRPESFSPLDFEHFYPPYSDDEHDQFSVMLRRQFLGLLSRLYRAASPGIDWFDGSVLDDNRFGARIIDCPEVGTITAKSLQSAYYACRIMPLVPKNGVVLEIGGGFGSLASRLLAIRPDITYLLTDLPVNMVLTHTYLTSLYGDAVAGLWDDGDELGPGHRAAIVPPWRLRSLPMRVDLAVNTMSFQHMDQRNHLFYGAAMRTLGTRRLYHVNRNVHITTPGEDTMVVPAEQYGFMKDFDVIESPDFDGKWIEVIANARG